jgi:phospholipase C
VVVGVYPHGVAIAPDGSTAYVANTGPNTGAGGAQTVSVIDVSSQSVSGQITVGEGPMTVAVSPDGSLVLVGCADGLYAINTAAGTARRVWDQGRNLQGIAFSPDGSVAYVAHPERNEVLVVELPSLRPAARIAVGQIPWDVAFTGDGGGAYVTNSGDGTVSVIDTASRRVTGSVPLGDGTLEGTNSTGASVPFTVSNNVPTAIALGPDGNIWVGCNVPGTIPVIAPSTNTVAHVIGIGIGYVPTAIAFVS